MSGSPPGDGLLARLLQGARERWSPRVRYTGTVREAAVAEVPNKARGRPPRRESRITLDVDEVLGPKGERRAGGGVASPVFTGPPELAARFGAGDRVLVVCPARFPRSIERITRMEEASTDDE